jgi:hypothetical protein
MQTFEITTTKKEVFSLTTGELICSEVIKQHDTLKDILRNLGLNVDGDKRKQYLKALSLLSGGMPLNKVISTIVGGADDE